MKNSKLKYSVKIAILSALAVVIMLFEFPLLFVAPGFYELDLSESVILMGGFALGPIAAAIMELVKNVLNLLINGTTTGFVGELANFVTGCCLTVPAALIYKYHKNIKGALVGMLVGIVSIGIAGGLINYFVMLPMYSAFMPLEQIIAAGKSITGIINDKFTFVLFAVVPFNFIKGILCSLISLILYKRLSRLLHR
ncbi:MAG: ECF transporter S component [Clostridia bacterium]|nr:ECF transporter S component [Clostridia bacterium]